MRRISTPISYWVECGEGTLMEMSTHEITQLIETGFIPVIHILPA